MIEFAARFSNLTAAPDERCFGRDPSNPYHDLLYWVSREMQPNRTVELGCCTGGSTSHLASGTAGKVISIDLEIRPEASERLSVFGNIELIHGDTRDQILSDDIAKGGAIDLLFIDTDHTAELVRIEMALFGPLVRTGGIILLDDIRMQPCMSSFWDELDEVKLELPEMHWTSFGVIFR